MTLCTKMNFDSLLVDHLGELGRYQIFILLFVCSAAINSTLNNFDYVFTGATPAFRCDVKASSQLMSNLSFDELSHLMSPLTSNGEPDVCLIYKYNYSSLTVYEARQILQSNNMTKIPTKNCENWIFNLDEHGSTIVTEWDLVCNKEWFVATSQALYMAGYYTVFVGGIFADKFGRRPVALACLIFLIVCRLFIDLSPNVYIYMIGRFLLCSSTANWFAVVSVIAMESVGPNKRTLAGQSPHFFWSVGYMILAVIAYFIRNWRTRNFVYLIFTVPFTLHFCFLPESVRWLKTKNRNQEALDVIKLIARVNKTKLPDELLFDFSKSKECDATEKSSWSSLVRSWMLIKITLIEIVIWMCVNAVYYGLIFYLPDLGGNIYLNTLISGVLELPALLYVQLTLDTRLGRTYNASLMFFITGVILVVLIFVPVQMTWLKITLALIGRFTMTTVFCIAYISTMEIFPTKMRSIGLSLCSSASRFTSVLSPYLARLGRFATFLPPLIFAGLSIMGALLYLLIPETRGKVLEDFEIQRTTQPIKEGYSKIEDPESTGTKMDMLK